jgi:hypothetical protein
MLHYANTDNVPGKDINSSWQVPQMPSARWVKAHFYGFWTSAWLQNEDVYGFWVQFDVESPYRRVSKVQEL